MKLLITGCTGLLGGRLAEFFSTIPHVSLLLASRNPDAIPNKLPNALYVRSVWDDEAQLLELCHGVDAVIHLAGLNAGDCSRATEEQLRQDVERTQDLLAAAAANNVERFIYMSTAHVYSPKLEGVINEESPLLNTHPYAANHVRKENIIRSAHERGEINGIIIRLSNAFGAPVTADTNCWMLLVSDLCRQITSTNKLELKTAGKQKRDFIPIGQCCKAVQHLLEIPEAKLDNGVFNVGGNWSISVLDMAQLIAERYQLISGDTVDVVVGDGNDASLPFVYSIDKLLASDFESQSDCTPESEIDSFLRFCINLSNEG